MKTARPATRLALVGLVLVAAVGLIAASGLDDSLVYYRSPTDVAGQPRTSERIRLGGLVTPGSVVLRGDHVDFTLTDGVHDVAVTHQGDPPGVFQEGQGALVEGAFGADDVFRSDVLIVKHSNEYRAADNVVDTTPADTSPPRR